MATIQPEQLIIQTRDLTLSSRPPTGPSGNDVGEASPQPLCALAEQAAIGAVVAAAQQVLETASAKAPGTKRASRSTLSTVKGPRANVEQASVSLPDLPNEVLMHILSFLDVNDLLSTSRTSHHLRCLALTPVLHAYRLRRTKQILPPLLTSPRRPSLADLIARSIFLTQTHVVSRRLARSLVAIRLQRRLAARPSAEVLVERCVLPRECVPGMTTVPVAPGLVARRKAIEKEKVKDGLRRWVGAVWKGEVRERGEGVRKWEERAGVGRVWRLRKFWERVGRGDDGGVGVR